MMNPIWKRRIAILVSIVMVFTIACLSRLVEGISFTAFAAEPPYARVGTATLSDEGDTVFIRMAKFNVGTEFLDLYLKTMGEVTRENKGWTLDFPVYLQGVLMNYLEQKMELSKF